MSCHVWMPPCKLARCFCCNGMHSGCHHVMPAWGVGRRHITVAIEELHEACVKQRSIVLCPLLIRCRNATASPVPAPQLRPCKSLLCLLGRMAGDGKVPVTVRIIDDVVRSARALDHRDVC